MLKAVSSITNAIGALNYKGTWDASTNTPTLASGAGTKGDYYVVSVAGTTTLDGISNWGIGDWAVFNGSVWQRVEGGADLNGVNLSVTGTTTLSGLTASTALALSSGKEVVSVTNTGSGNNVLDTSPQISTPTLAGDVQMSTGNLVIGTSGKGIDFSATPGTGTSELLSDYEEGTWTPVGNGITFSAAAGRYVKVGKLVIVSGRVSFPVTASGSGANITSLPFTSSSTTGAFDASGGAYATYTDYGSAITGLVQPNTAYFSLYTLTGAALLNSNWSGKTLYFTCVYHSA